LQSHRPVRGLSEPFDAFLAAGKRPGGDVAVILNGVPAIPYAAHIGLVLIDVVGSCHCEAPLHRFDPAPFSELLFRAQKRVGPANRLPHQWLKELPSAFLRHLGKSGIDRRRSSAAKLWSIEVPTALHELADDIVMAERRCQLDLGYNTIQPPRTVQRRSVRAPQTWCARTNAVANGNCRIRAQS